jgi:hypothetical protein
MIQILQYIACVLTILVGAYALVSPKGTTNFTGISPLGGRGITEIRVIFGVLFITIGLYPLMSASPAAYQMLGCTYLSLGVVRLISIFIDKSSEQSNWISVAVEIVFGAILVI